MMVFVMLMTTMTMMFLVTMLMPMVMMIIIRLPESPMEGRGGAAFAAVRVSSRFALHHISPFLLNISSYFICIGYLHFIGDHLVDDNHHHIMLSYRLNNISLTILWFNVNIYISSQDKLMVLGGFAGDF